MEAIHTGQTKELRALACHKFPRTGIRVRQAQKTQEEVHPKKGLHVDTCDTCDRHRRPKKGYTQEEVTFKKLVIPATGTSYIQKNQERVGIFLHHQFPICYTTYDCTAQKRIPIE
jgi:hypothetical protein